MKHILIVAAVLAVGLAGCSKSFTPPPALDIQFKALYDGAECNTLDTEYTAHSEKWNAIEDNLSGNAGKTAAKVLGLGLFALADGDLSGNERRAVQKTHGEHMTYINIAGAKKECSGFPKTLPF